VYKDITISYENLAKLPSMYGDEKDQEPADLNVIYTTKEPKLTDEHLGNTFVP
jgi:hypothetical protein